MPGEAEAPPLGELPVLRPHSGERLTSGSRVELPNFLSGDVLGLAADGLGRTVARRGEEAGPPVSGRVGGGRGRMAAPCDEEALPLVPGRGAAGGLGRTVVAQRGDEVCGRVGEPLRRRMAERRGVERCGHSSPGRGSSWVYAGSGRCGARILEEAASLAVRAAAASTSKDHHASAKSLLAAGGSPSRRGAGGGIIVGLSTVPKRAARVVLGAGANVVK